MATPEEAVLELLRVQLNVPAALPGDRIVEDLGAESADIVSILAALEERFAITIDEEEIPSIRTAQDLIRVVRSRP